MIDDPKKPASDVEYQFPQDEYVSADHDSALHESHDQTHNTESAFVSADAPIGSGGFGAKVSSWFSQSELLKNKRIIGAIVLVIVMAILMGVFSSGKKTPPVVTPKKIEKPIVAPVITPVNNETLQSLEPIDPTATQIKTLQSQVNSMQDAINQSQADNQQLHQSVETLATQVSNLSNEVNTLISKLSALPKGKEVLFHLRAILPDRAWIRSDSGETLTVTIGDHVPQYGKITAIHANQGFIETTSGRNIKYGSNDR